MKKFYFKAIVNHVVEYIVEAIDGTFARQYVKSGFDRDDCQVLDQSNPVHSVGIYDDNTEKNIEIIESRPVSDKEAFEFSTNQCRELLCKMRDFELPNEMIEEAAKFLNVDQD